MKAIVTSIDEEFEKGRGPDKKSRRRRSEPRPSKNLREVKKLPKGAKSGDLFKLLMGIKPRNWR